jgi:hypothetical protein
VLTSSRKEQQPCDTNPLPKRSIKVGPNEADDAHTIQKADFADAITAMTAMRGVAVGAPEPADEVALSAAMSGPRC